ncbi:hypothetical protein IAT38_006354 [Cryptococcus sp. DSM 104549]
MSFTAGIGGAHSYDRTGHTAGTPLDRTTSHPHFTDNQPGDDLPHQTEEDRTREIGHLARQLSRQSVAGPQDTSQLFDYEKGGDLDPFSKEFDARKWTKMMMSASQESGPSRRAGLSFANMSVHGFGSDADYQTTVGNIALYGFNALRDAIRNRKHKVQILNSIDGVLEAGEMLVVLGPPGSGCSTMLKTIAGEMNGIFLDEKSDLNYRGITPKQMHGQFRGEAIYTAEVDVHFPNLTVGQTLSFAAEARAPRHPPGGISKRHYAERMRDVLMSVFGISHTINTIVGNDFVRGVSGGERKRVTIAEAALAGAPLQCWDNSTRGLDSANAIEFCKNLRLNADYLDISSVVAIYQAPQSAYDVFDKVSVLYEGEQIFFGKTTDAKRFFVNMGFYCPEQQTVPDFLTSLTSPSERRAQEGFEGRVPATPQEFAAAWKSSPEYAALKEQIGAFQQKYPVHGEQYDEFLASRRAQQSKHLRPKSPYTLSYGSQVELCLRRGFMRLVADPSLTYTQLFGNFIMALIIGSVYYNLPVSTSSFFARGGLLFFAVLLSAFSSALEILILYAQRGIVEKHSRYAFYHPSAEAVASSLTDIPYKITNCVAFNLTLYFMTNLRREPGPFFFFMLISFTVTMVMSMIFRSIASMSRSMAQALAPAAILILGLVIYTGFALPIDYMPGWSRWMNYINPIAYGFESMMVNEFVGRRYECSQFVPTGPGYEGASGVERVCSAVGSEAGASSVDGATYLHLAYKYEHAHKWRNVGIMIGFFLFFTALHFLTTEYITAKKSKGEVLVFPRGRIPSSFKSLSTTSSNDVESKGIDGGNVARQSAGADSTDKAAIIQRQTAIFSWKDVVYDIKIKKEERRILDHVDGWVKPGTLTALMGVSGAGKTTLLDVLATRVTMGVVTGEMLVDGEQRDVSFQRKTGYVQQQDLHLETSTVREALRFSAVLRQPHKVPTAEKYEYVEEVLKLLEMDGYADAVVGVPGTGLNVEQRKRLTIGVELVAKPALLLFLDEPTSGLDSQTSWNILQLLRKLTAHGQAILCTIHQPSAMLFEQFDRLLFLARGGKTVYYGEVGQESRILIDYFERNGAPPCPVGENPAEWMLSAIGAAPGSHTNVDWHQAWLASPERVAVREELARIKASHGGKGATEESVASEDTAVEKTKSERKAEYAEFASPLSLQFVVVLKRALQQHWRTPSYILSKAFLCIVSGIYIGFSFYNAGTSQQDLQNQLFSIFMLFTIFGQIVEQIAPEFVVQRSLYEVRERPSKTYSWKAFILSNIVAEIPWSLLLGVGIYFTMYYPIGFYKNAIPTNSVNLRGALVFLYIEMYMLYASTFAVMITAGVGSAETAANIANLLFMFCLIFCGVLVPGSELPRFWIFMYRVSPFTYLVEGILGTALANNSVVCSATELLTFTAPAGQTCGEYMAGYMSMAGGYLVDEAASVCEFCALSSTNVFLQKFGIYYSHKWRDFGIMWAFVISNIVGAIFFYWLARVPKNTGKERATASEPEDGLGEKAGLGKKAVEAEGQ